MSVQAMAWVFDSSTATEGARLVLLAIANHYNNTTGLCCPSYDLLAREARLSRRATIDAVTRLERDGHIQIERGAGRGHTNTYFILGFSKGADPALFPDGERVQVDALKGAGDNNPTLYQSQLTNAGSRKRDPFFDAVVDCWRYNVHELTKDERGKLNRAVKQLKDIGANPAEIARRRAAYRRKYPGAADTPLALVGHWSELGQAQEPTTEDYARGTY